MNNRLWRALTCFPALALLAGTGTVIAGAAPAAASPVGCGMVVTQSITLTHNLGPCPGDGLDVVASGVVVNLNGFTIIGSDTTNTSGAAEDQQIGVHLLNVQGVIVTGPGAITKFDAGVGIDGGSGNLVKDLNVHDNVAHVILTGDNNGGDPDLDACDFGDGITTDNSSANTISNNTVTRNGPFSGISLVDNSDNNVVTGNAVFNNTVPNDIGLVPGNPGPCGPFGASITGPGREHQDTGIRMEGPGANGNMVVANRVTDNMLSGIAVFDNICAVNPIGLPNGTPPNDGNVIQSNTVLRNGGTDKLDGISTLQQGPTGTVCVPSNTTIVANTTNNNTGNGISLGGRGSHDNIVTGNTANNNGIDGIHLTGPPNGTVPGAINNTIAGNTALGNVRWDAFDGTFNPPCDNNHWTGNHFVKVNQSCIH
jgi:parallel beta-helix repeat protein